MSSNRRTVKKLPEGCICNCTSFSEKRTGQTSAGPKTPGMISNTSLWELLYGSPMAAHSFDKTFIKLKKI